MPVPINPVIYASLRAIYAGGTGKRWKADSYGRPVYRYETRGGRILIFFAPPPYFGSRYNPSIAMYYTPRLEFIYSGSLRESMQQLSVETADVFLILMSRIAELRDPRNDIAQITLEDFAGIRGVRVRHGSARTLYEDFKKEILLLSDLRLMMNWKSYLKGGEIAFGRDIPDRLLDILDLEYRKAENSWTSFRFRCGQALSYFLNPEGLFWIGRYSRALLHLNPYKEAFTKKLGAYWILVGTVTMKKGLLPRATPWSILDFCGEEVDRRNPGAIVDAFIEGHCRLKELRVLDEIPDLEPLSRRKGYFQEWLETPLEISLSDNIKSGVPGKARSRIKPAGLRRREKESRIDPEELMNRPSLIRQFRLESGLCQAELARILGITRQTLSLYERGLRILSRDKAQKIHTAYERIRSREASSDKDRRRILMPE